MQIQESEYDPAGDARLYENVAKGLPPADAQFRFDRPERNLAASDEDQVPVAGDDRRRRVVEHEADAHIAADAQLRKLAERCEGERSLPTKRAFAVDHRR